MGGRPAGDRCPAREAASVSAWDDKRWPWAYATGTALLKSGGRLIPYERLHYVPSQRDNVTYRRCRISAVHQKPR